MPAKVYHYDLFGKREAKYDFLKNNSVSTVDWTELDPDDKYHFFVPKDFALQEEWEKGVKVSELFEVFNSGVKTDRDSLFIDQNKNELSKRFQTLLSGDFDMQFRDKYRVKDSGSFKITERIKNKTFDDKFIRKIQYRPFDYQWIYYDPEIVSRPADKSMRNMFFDNIMLISCRNQNPNGNIGLVSKYFSDIRTFSNPGSIGSDYTFPLYLYPQNNGDLMQEQKPKPNFNPKIIKQIEAELGLQLDWEAGIETTKTPSPEGEVWGEDTEDNHGENKHTENQQPKPRIYQNVSPETLTFAKQMRHDPTGGEKLGWYIFRNRRFKGLKFRRQHPVEKYILDFYCHELKLAVEIDGPEHDKPEQKAKDQIRTQFLNSKGIKVFRIKHDRFLVNTEFVLKELEEFIDGTLPSPLPGITSLPSPLLEERGYFTPTDLLDYIYAVLHSPSYREKYKEFLKIDFPRIPFDLSKNSPFSERGATEGGGVCSKFWQLVKLGSELRKLHLMEGINPLELEQAEISGEGENVVEKIRFETSPKIKDFDPLEGVIGKVYINKTKYFDNIPESVWNFYIGGYQPAQKWLKDRKGRELTFDDILHYQKIVWVLGETQRVMGGGVESVLR